MSTLSHLLTQGGRKTSFRADAAATFVQAIRAAFRKVEFGVGGGGVESKVRDSVAI